MPRKIRAPAQPKRYQVPFRYEEKDNKLIAQLQKEYCEITISKVLKRALREAAEFIAFKKRVGNAIKKRYEIDNTAVEREFHRFQF